MNEFVGHVMDAVKAILEGAAIGLGAAVVIGLPIVAVVGIAGGIYWIWDQYIR